MDKTLAGLIGAVSVLAAASPARADAAAPPSIDSAMQFRSYADLLKPIPNALAVLKAQPLANPGEPELEGTATVQDVQYHHHHHHHHHRYYRRWRRHYHHHHHHHHHHHS